MNDAAYVNLNINELRDGADERGNDHSVSVYVPQEQRSQFPDRIYIGRGKEWHDEQHSGGTSFDRKPSRPADDDPTNDLPW